MIHVTKVTYLTYGGRTIDVEYNTTFHEPLWKAKELLLDSVCKKDSSDPIVKVKKILNIENMEKKINIAELLKDCPQGMELDCAIWNSEAKVFLEGVLDDDFSYPIEVTVKYNNHECTKSFTKYGAFNDLPYCNCVIYPKGKTTWEGFQRPFKDGDVIFTHTGDYAWVSIFKQISGNSCCTHIDLCINDNDLIIDARCLCDIGEINTQRLATEEEKQKLFQAIKDNGYKWNAETKTLEKLIEPKFKVGDIIQDTDSYKVKITEVNVECYGYESVIAEGIGCIGFNEQDNWELVPNKFDISNLVPFESRVLARDRDASAWYPYFWGYYSKVYEYPFVVVGGKAFTQCIPYEGNEHLLGTKDDCDDFYKTW